jgi:hypothetical protein
MRGADRRSAACSTAGIHGLTLSVVRPRLAAVTVVLIVVILVAVPINWHAIDWGNAPEWFGVMALLLVAGAAWTAVFSRTGRHDRSDLR